MIWEVKAVPMMAFFWVWKVPQERILTLDKLVERGIILVNGWYMCKKDAESFSHTLLWCPHVHRLWSLAYSLLGLRGKLSRFTSNLLG